MKKYSELILESVLTRPSFVYKLGMSRDFITYECGMFKAINKLVANNSTPKNFNPDYQIGLSLLYKTGKYSDIKYNGVVYSTFKLNNLNKVLDSAGNWHPVNKLNTNSFDQAELLYDLYKSIGVYDEVGNIQNDNDEKGSTISISELKEMQNDNVPVRSKRRKSDRNTVSLDI